MSMSFNAGLYGKYPSHPVKIAPYMYGTIPTVWDPVRAIICIPYVPCYVWLVSYRIFNGKRVSHIVWDQHFHWTTDERIFAYLNKKWGKGGYEIIRIKRTEEEV